MDTLLDRGVEPQAQGGYRANLPAKKILRVLAASAIVLAGLVAVALAGRPATKDYISYWSAGKLLVHHADPYSSASVLALEKTQGYSENRPIIMRNPPWALFLAVPLAFEDPDDCCRRMHRWIHSTDECTVRRSCFRIPLCSSTLCFLHRPELAVSLARLFVVFALLPAQVVPRRSFFAHGDQTASISRFLDGASGRLHLSAQILRASRRPFRACRWNGICNVPRCPYLAALFRDVASCHA
jgi:hypothetical protein